MINQRYSTDLFIYNKKARRFSQEASTLQFPAGKHPNRITLQNPKTLGLCVFKFVMITENNGDLETWEYISIARTIGIHLTIFND